MIRFDIDQWCAWPPAAAGDSPATSGDAPDVSFLPAMQRRRLSRLSRLAFATAWPLAQEGLPLVFASRHGETVRAEALLTDIAEGESLSPTQFSLSVHNAFAGLWSILRGDGSEMTAIAAEGDGLEHAILEAAALLDEGAPAVLVVVAEDEPAPAFSRWIEDIPYAYALALRLRTGEGWALQLAPRAESAPTVSRPHALNLRDALAGNNNRLEHHWKRRTWTWQRRR